MNKKPLAQTADALLSEPIEFTVPIQLKWWEKLLGREHEKTFVVHPMWNGTMIRICKILLKLDTGRITENNLQQLLKNGIQFMNANYEVTAHQGRRLATIVACAVHNQREKPPRELIDFLLWNMTPDQLRAIVVKIVEMMPVSDFTSSIISVRGLNVLEDQDATARIADLANEVNPVSQGS